MPIFSIKMYTLNVILITSEVFYNDTGIFLIKIILKNKLLKITKSIVKLMNVDDLSHKIASFM